MHRSKVACIVFSQIAIVRVVLPTAFPHTSQLGLQTALLPYILASSLCLLETMVLILVVANVVGGVKQI